MQILYKGNMMNSITNSQAPVPVQISALKKSEEVAAQSMSKIFDSATIDSKNIQASQAHDMQMQHSTAQKTGLGQSLDLKV